ncbi:MAG TPA: DUF1549 domain-containing protein [Urbifossiella sp.]|jgi:hypothetical protein|nr:DUF1549 domain-containing protein [Urbifossiella sp.]
MPRLVAALAALAFAAGSARADAPLAPRVDALIDAKAKADAVPLSPPADDGEFLRRATLDLAGTIPTADEAKAFLADTDPRRREKTLAALLAAPGYADRMTDLFHVVLMERLGDHPEWTTYLKSSFAANAPWDGMVRDMLRADPKEPDKLGAAFFLARRLENYGQNPVDHSALTRDVGRLFLGKNFQCCECHDHLFVEDYKQQDFQGLHAFFRNATLVSAAKLHVAEKPTTEKLGFASVFTKVPLATAPALPGGKMVDIPSFPKGQEFAEPPDRKTGSPGVPKFRTLAAAADLIPRAENRDFARNIVNRVWFALLGRGFVHPLDMHHGRNPGSHPELLDLLADEFVAHTFDLKWLIGELVRTRAYQRSSRLPGGAAVPDPWYFGTAIEKRLTAEQLLRAMVAATGTDPKAAEALRPKFLKAFANQPRDPEDEITPSLRAALFLLHDAAVLKLFEPTPGNLVARLAALPDDRVAEDLYLAVLTRRPTAEEEQTVRDLLTRRAGARTAAVGRLAWALAASMEFGVNH